MDALQQAARIQLRLRQASSLAGTLAASFDAFEAIRLLARGNEHRDPSLFAAFMLAADAAVDGREALPLSPSLPPATRHQPAVTPAEGADLDDIADAMAGLATQLADCLARAATMAGTSGDRAACEQAAHAAGQIRQLMARGDDDPGLR
ncbi:MAG: hypothetical protein ACRDPY_28565 [Streptosporangiaceae bacterium]